LETSIVVVALIAFVAFRQWMQHQRRVLIHKERLAAIEKGVDLPPLEQEVARRTVNIQRILLLMGLIWLTIGIGAYVVLSAILSYPSTAQTTEILPGMQYIGIVPFGIGLAHLITYLVGPKKAA
jgi:small-conductance mechanosensitive channel